jgi:hypothetical protein
LKEFEQFMATRDLVPEAHRSFYVNWVRRFLNSGEKGRSDILLFLQKKIRLSN